MRPFQAPLAARRATTLLTRTPLTRTFLTRTLLATTLAAVPLLAGAAAASAADAIPDIAPEPAPITEEAFRRAYLAVRGSYNPFGQDIDVRSPAVPGGIVSGRASGDLPALPATLETDYAVGGTLEGGMFLTPNVRVGVELGYGHVAAESLTIAPSAATTVPVFVPGPPPVLAARIDLSGTARLDGGTDVLTGFVKGAYEVPVLEGFAFIERFSLFGTAGVGLVNVRPDVTFLNGPFAGTRIDGSDTVVAGKVGFGSVTQLTDRIELTSEYNYVFGPDAEFALTSTPSGADVPFSIDTSAHVVQSGLRFRF